MSREICADYDQLLMFPPAVDDWVGSDHPARFVRDFVDSLDLESLGFRVRESTMGRPHYGAALLLKVWLYGYLNSIRSSRKLERAQRNEVGEYRLPESLQDHEERKKFIHQAILKLEEEDANHLHPGEPDARLMKNGRTIELSYNAQAVAEQESGMIVGADARSSARKPRGDSSRESCRWELCISSAD